MHINVTNILNFVESPQNKENTELENQISHEVDKAKLEMPSKVINACDEDQSSKMEVAENVEVPTHQMVVQQEELQVLEEPKTEVSKEEPGFPKSIVESITVALVSPSEESTLLSCKEHLVTERVQEGKEQKESELSCRSTNFEMTPAVHSCVKDGSCQGDKSVSSEALSSFSSSGDLNKAVVSSSPALCSDLPPQDILHSFPSTLSSAVGNIMPTTYISVTPKIGMGKPAISKRKFSPGRPRSKQVG